MEYVCTYTKIDCVQTGKKLTELMALQAVDVKQLANTLGVSNQAVYKWQSGQAMPTIDNMVILASIFGVKIDNIIVFQKMMIHRSHSRDCFGYMASSSNL